MLVESLSMTEAPRPPAGDRPGENGPRSRSRREGSRVLLAAALAVAVVAAFLAGGFVASALSGLLGIASPAVRLALRLLAVVVAIPAAFYLVERLFLKRTSRP